MYSCDFASACIMLQHTIVATRISTSPAAANILTWSWLVRWLNCKTSVNDVKSAQTILQLLRISGPGNRSWEVTQQAYNAYSMHTIYTEIRTFTQSDAHLHWQLPWMCWRWRSRTWWRRQKRPSKWMGTGWLGWLNIKSIENRECRWEMREQRTNTHTCTMEPKLKREMKKKQTMNGGQTRQRQQKLNKPGRMHVKLATSSFAFC